MRGLSAANGSRAFTRSCPKIQGGSFLRGQRLSHRSTRQGQCQSSTFLVIAAAAADSAKSSPAPAETERFRLNNLAPQPGSRRKHTRKGRGYGAGQGGPCGFGMRGQNSRSGPGTRPGFEGGQMPLYRRLPKLRGIAGGMSAGVPKYVTVNLRQLGEKFSKSEEVSLESLQAKRVLNVSGKEAKLPLKILGDGDLKSPLTIKATEFSASARQKIEAAGGKIIEVPKKIVWTRKIGEKRKAENAAAAPPKPAQQSSGKNKAQQTKKSG